jgi:hypothetical protein
VLGNTAYYTTSGVETGCPTDIDQCITNTGPFKNIQPSYYWSATEYAPDANFAWVFLMAEGNQDYSYKYHSFYAWAVHSGDVSAVPVPAAAWLFGSGLIGLTGIARRKRANI